MVAQVQNLLRTITGPKQFIIPIYQRTYSWRESECDQLFNDILLKVGKADSAEGHFIGSIVYFQARVQNTSAVPKLLVIDGQQRLTTVLLLIIALSEFIRDKKVEIDTSYIRLQNYYLLNAEEEGELRYKLLLTRKDKETFKMLIDDRATSDENSLLVKNYKFFKEKISNENFRKVYEGIQKLFIVDVVLEKGQDNPQLIFESMNSTGKALSKADLIRNYVLMGLDDRLQTELYENYWFPMEESYGNEYAEKFNKFIRDYLTVKTKSIPKEDEVYEAFKAYAQNKETPEPITDVIKDILKYSNYYVNMVLKKEEDSDLERLFDNIIALNVGVSYPFLLPVYSDYKAGIITKEDFKEIIKLVESYVFRRAVCGIPTNSLNKIFSELYKSIDQSNYLESLKAAFQLMENYKRFPNDAEFENALTQRDIYNLRFRNYLLHNLENFNRREIVKTSEYTIEHIMPQNPKLDIEWQAMLGDNWQEVQKKYLHTLGNLTLTGYNRELSDSPFNVKRSITGGFNTSPLCWLNSFIQNMGEEEKWNEENILARAKELAARASQIWATPNVSEEILGKYRRTEEQDATVYTIEDYQYLRGEMLELYRVLQKRILNIDASVGVNYRKHYIVFKSNISFVFVEPQSAQLKLCLNVEFDQINDPKDLCVDITNKGHLGDGDVRIKISTMSELDYAMDLIQQAFDIQME